jgi:rubrerythrin
METREKLIQLIKEQIEIEKENVRQVNETEKKVDNAAAKLSLLEIRLDSQKHADILDGILEVLSGVPASKTLWEHRIESYIDPFVVQRELENHEQREAEMIEHVEEEIKHTEDEGLKLLLQHVLDDERKHHKILETLVKHLHKVNP